MISPLGRGAYSTVYKVKSRISGEFYALKVICRNKLNQARITKRLINEIKLQSQVNHPNVVKLILSFEDEENVYLLLELCQGGELFSYIKAEGKLSESETRRIINQIAEGIGCLHSKNILHRDLKLGNLLFSEDKSIIKIGDFGLAVQLTDLAEERRTLCGTPNYISPEIVSRKPYGLSSDLWSLGCIVYACLTGNPPFESASIQNTLLKLKDLKYSLPDYLSNCAVDLITSLLSWEPKTRLNIFQVKSHSFFKVTGKKVPSLFTQTLSPINKSSEYSESMESSRFIPSQHYISRMHQNNSKKLLQYDKENVNPNKTEKVSALTTQNLSPFIHKLNKGELEIAQDGWVRVQVGKRKLEVSGDGITALYQGRMIDVKNMQSAPARLYRLAGEFLEVIKSKTPKIVLHENNAKCMLMRNTPFPNYEADFQDGVRVKYQLGSEVFTIYTLEGKEIQVNPYLDTKHLGPVLLQTLETSMEGLKKCLSKEREII